MTPEQRDRIAAEGRRLRQEGLSWRAIGRIFGVGDQTVRYWADPDRAQEVRAASASNRAAGRKQGGRPSREDSAAGRADVMARLAEIPPDTRSITARLFGDPLPGRSALERERVRP